MLLRPHIVALARRSARGGRLAREGCASKRRFRCHVTRRQLYAAPAIADEVAARLRHRLREKATVAPVAHVRSVTQVGAGAYHTRALR